MPAPIISGGKGTAADKFGALEAAGVRTVQSPAELGAAMAELLRKRRAKAARGARARDPRSRRRRPRRREAARRKRDGGASAKAKPRRRPRRRPQAQGARRRPRPRRSRRPSPRRKAPQAGRQGCVRARPARRAAVVADRRARPRRPDVSARRLSIALAQLDLPGRRRRAATPRACSSSPRRRAREQGADLVRLPRTRAVRLSARRPAVPPRPAPPGGRRRWSAAARGRRAASRVLVGYPEYVAATARSSTPPRCSPTARCRRQPPQALPAELPRVRREALFRGRARSRRSSTFRGFRLGLLICEDIWEPEPRAAARRRGRRAPARHQRLALRAAASSARARQWCAQRVARRRPAGGLRELVGGQDELVFDGGSFVMDAAGRRRAARAGVRGGAAAASTLRDAARRRRAGAAGARGRRRAASSPTRRASIGALVLGVRDYVDKHGFPGVVHRPLRRHRLGADAGDRGGCAGRRTRAGGDDAVALHRRT